MLKKLFYQVNSTTPKLKISILHPYGSSFRTSGATNPGVPHLIANKIIAISDLLNI